MIVLALVLFSLGLLWHCWRLSFSQGDAGSIRRMIDVLVTAGFFAGGTQVMLNEYLNLGVGLATLSIFLIFVLFIDAAYSALRFHVEDRDRNK